MFTTVSTTTCHLSSSWARWTQSTPSHSTASGFQTISLPSHACNVPCPPNSSWYDHPNNIWCELQKMEHLIMQFSPASVTCHLIIKINTTNNIMNSWGLGPTGPVLLIQNMFNSGKWPSSILPTFLVFALVLNDVFNYLDTCNLYTELHVYLLVKYS